MMPPRHGDETDSDDDFIFRDAADFHGNPQNEDTGSDSEGTEEEDTVSDDDEPVQVEAPNVLRRSGRTKRVPMWHTDYELE